MATKKRYNDKEDARQRKMTARITRERLLGELEDANDIQAIKVIIRQLIERIH